MIVDDKTDRQAREGVRAREDIADVRDVETSEDMEFDTATPETHETAGHADNTLQEDAAASRKTMALGGERGISRRLRKLKVVPVAVVLLMAISAALAAWLYFYQYRPDQQTDAGAARVAVAAATEGTVALLSYSPDTVDQDVATARSHLTGDLLSYYDAFTQQIVAPAAKQKSVKTTAAVVTGSVSELHPDSAVVLVFVNQSTTSKDTPDPSISASSVQVTLTKADGNWLISKFDPV